MKRYRQKGFDLDPNQGLYTTREKDGLWSAWVDDEAPASPCDETVKLFVGSSAFQAQLKAIRALREAREGDAQDGSLCL